MSQTAGAQLGIPGLPTPVGALAGGQLYSLSVADPVANAALLVGLVRGAVSAKRPLALLCEAPARVAQDLGDAGLDVRRLHQRRQLRLFALADAQTLLSRVGPAQLLDEVDHFGFGAGSLVVVVPADAAFSWEPGALARFVSIYQGWARVQDATMLFVFSTGELPVGRAEAIASAVPQAVAGLAHLHRDEAQTWIWETRHWHRAESAARHVQRLQRGGDGGLMPVPDALAELEAWTRTAASAPDRERVYATEIAAEGRRDWPPEWVIAHDGQHLEDLSAGAVAATCLIDAADIQQFQNLARRVHRLRRRAGRALKIIVRESGTRLRYGQTHVLLSLGATAVLNADLRRAAVLEQLAAMSGRLYVGQIPADFDAAFAAAMPPLLSGYQPVPDFTVALHRGLERARSSGLQCVLLRCFVSDELPIIEALRVCRPVRPGDVCTADAQSVYLFLDACAPPDVDAALQRIMRRPVAQWSSGQLRFVGFDAMRAELTDLERRHAETPFPDHRFGLRQATQRPDAGASRAATDAVRSGIERSVQQAPLALHALAKGS